MFTKVAKDSLEIELQDIASKHGFAPRIERIDGLVVQMESVNGACLADIYTDDPKKVPDFVWAEIHRILAVLYEVEGIEYVDITPYNFTEKDDKVYIIDFGDAQYALKDNIDWFLREFLDGENSWNPDYK